MIAELAKSSTIINSESAGNVGEEELSAHQHPPNTTSSRDETDSNSNEDNINTERQPCRDTNKKDMGQCYDKDCSECRIQRRDPTPDELTMCLHALSYKVTYSNARTHHEKLTALGRNEKQLFS